MITKLEAYRLFLTRVNRGIRWAEMQTGYGASGVTLANGLKLYCTNGCYHLGR